MPTITVIIVNENSENTKIEKKHICLQNKIQTFFLTKVKLIENTSYIYKTN